MANATFKKSAITLILFLIFSSSVFSQKKQLKEFSKEFSVYLTDLDGFMTATKNDALQSVYRNFSKNSKGLSEIEKRNIIQISNKMLSKRLRPKPHFFNFLSAVIDIKNHSRGDVLLAQWLQVFNETLDANTTNKLMLFCGFTSNLVRNNSLRESKSVQWMISNVEFQFQFEMIEPVVVFDVPMNLSCNSSDGSYTIFDTKGKYYFVSNEWVGQGGVIDWEFYGYSKDSMFAEIKSYNVDTRKKIVVADSAVFYNKYVFSDPIVGQVVHKLTKGKQAEMYPQFTSYSKNVEIKEIFSDIDYRGGYKLQGEEFVADGGDYAEAKIVFKRNGQDIFIANSNRFSIGSDKIISQEAAVNIFFDNDSIFHSNINFKYIDSERKLKLYRDANGNSSATMLNTYHNITMDFELLQWNIDEDLIKFGSLPGTSTSKVSFESVLRYDTLLNFMLGGIDAVHPLFLLNNYVKEKQEEKIYVQDFARFARFPIKQIKNLLIRLSKYGFIYYDFGVERITVLPKLYNYVSAASGLGDYDYIVFNSVIESGQYITEDKYLVNAALNLATKDLSILGVNEISISPARGVYLYPAGGLMVLKKNRDFIFNGKVVVGDGRLNLSGREFRFYYDDFKIDLEYVDFMQRSIPIEPIQKYNGKVVLKPVKTLIETATGELIIDDVTNKSGFRKDSFPQFPIFKSFDDSYVYWDDKEVYNGVYSRDRFSFHLQPFELDSLAISSGKGDWYAGTFESNIFPVFNDTLRLQKDDHLGFTRKTPDDGFLVYGGKGKFYNDIHLSYQGLKGSGDFEYLNSKASSNEVFFFPDSVNLYTQSFAITEVAKGIEFPQVNNTESYARFEPYNDRFKIYKTKDDFELYGSQVTFNGDLLMRPTGLTGGGIMSLDKANVTAELFTYNADWFKSENSDLDVFSDNGQLSIETVNLKSHIDLAMREGTFNSNGNNSYVKFPANQYVAHIDKLEWAIDEETFVLGDQTNSSEGSEFISVHPNQDSLSFFAKTAFYSLKDYIIHTSGVEDIVVADAIIYPDSGIVTVAKKANIETLHQANILANDLTEYHTFSNATVDIKSAYDYIASADYTYKDALDNEHQIFFKEIKVDEDTITIASGNITTDKIFQINSNFDFKGSVDLIADQKDLIFDGYFMINHDCDLLDKEWIKFRSKVDPKNVKFMLDENIYNEQGDLLSIGLVLGSSTDFYSTFLTKKKNNKTDISVFSSSYALQYNDKNSTYVIAGPDSLSNQYVLYDKMCKNSGEGIIDLDLNLGQVKVQAFGNVMHDINAKKTEVEGFIMLDFFFSEDAMMFMAEDLSYYRDEKEFAYDDNFSKNLGRVLGYEKAKSLLEDLEYLDDYSKFPKEMEQSIVLAKTKLQWDVENKAYVFKGPIAVHSIMDQHLNSTHQGYLIIEKGSNLDVLIFYLDTELYDYYFKYENGVMQAWSDNLDFEIAINEIKEKKRKAKRSKGARSYRYMFIPEDVAMKSLKKIKQKY